MPQYVQLNFPDSADTDESNAKQWAVWEKGFRPFFLGGSTLAALLIAVWLLVYFTPLSLGEPLAPVAWHAHEMLFGFVPAVIAGFLLTAVPRWTGGNTPTGGLLAAMFGLWIAGRLAMVSTSVIPYEVAAGIEVAFLPALAVAVAIPIVRSRTFRNLGFIPILAALAAANGWFHLAQLDLVYGSASAGFDAALGLIILIIAVVGGRVVPFFAASALGGSTPDRRRIVDITAIAAIIAWLVALVADPSSVVTGGLALAAGATNIARMTSWKPLESLRVPLMWVLQIGYLFVGLGLAVHGVATLTSVATISIATHLLTAGAIGTMCIGMMARVSLGHTGRELEAPPLVVVAFVLVIGAAVLRGILPWIWPAGYTAALIGSGLVWAVAWSLFVVVYTPILLRPRADGRPG